MGKQNRDRHVFGETNPIYCRATESGEMIETGDMVVMRGNTLYPNKYAWGTDPVNDNFIGVAMQYAIGQDPATIRVATTGVFEFDCSDTFVIGEGVYQLINSQFVYGRGDRSTVGGIIGRAWKRYPSTTTKVLVKIDNKAFFPRAT